MVPEQLLNVAGNVKEMNKTMCPARALIGWMNEEQALLTLAGRRADQQVCPEHIQRAEQARKTVASRPAGVDQAHLVGPVPDDLVGHIETLRQHPASAPYFNEGWRVAIVDLSKVCAAQPCVFTEHADARVVGVDANSIVSLATVSLPIPTPSVVSAQYNLFNNTWVFSSPNPNLRIVGPIPPGVNGVGFVVAITPSLMQVISCRGRYLLRDGYHRAYGFLQRGITKVPALVREVDTFEGLGLPIGLLPQDAFLGDRPPMLTDYSSDDVSSDIVMPATQKVVIIHALELNTLG